MSATSKIIKPNKKSGINVPETDSFEKGIKRWIRSSFSPQYWYKFKVVLETRIYNTDVKGTEFVWEQKKGQRARICEVYFDDEYVCDIDENMSRPQAEIAMTVGLNRIKEEREKRAEAYAV